MRNVRTIDVVCGLANMYHIPPKVIMDVYLRFQDRVHSREVYKAGKWINDNLELEEHCKAATIKYYGIYYKRLK